jgi:hypothetical protein
MVRKTYDKHLKSLTRADPGSKENIDKIFANPVFINVLTKVRKDILSEKRSFLEFNPSHSASFEFQRSRGGQAAYLREQVGIDGRIASSSLLRMEWRPRMVTASGDHTQRACSVYVSKGSDEWRELLLVENLPDVANCEIRAVLEPLKIRVISKGNSIPYYMAKPLQVAMHSSLRKMAPFRLIGRPFSADDLVGLRRDVNDHWFSIDYSAATDFLSWRYSRRILDFLMTGSTPAQRRMAYTVLGPHGLWYPDAEGPCRSFKGIQTNGQLMGSVLSFPILCLANFGLFLLTNYDRFESWSEEEILSSVLINGDDMLYAAPPSLWADHIRYGRSLGLEMSVGKAYVHPVYANINSESIHMHPGEDVPFPIPFLNTGLLFGVHKVLSKGEGEELFRIDSVGQQSCQELGYDARKGIVPTLNKLLRGALPFKKHDIMKKVLLLHSESIRWETLVSSNVGVRFPGTRSKFVTRNLFLPESVGGMGVDPPLDSRLGKWKFKVSKCDRVRALSLIKPYLPSCFGLPLPGYPIQELNSYCESPWSTSSGVSVRLDERISWKGRLPKRSLLVQGLYHYTYSRTSTFVL